VGQRDDVLYNERRNFAINALHEHLPGIPHTTPDGAFYILLNCSQFTNDSLEFALRILNDTDVLTTPGLAFGESTRSWLRLSFAGKPETFVEGTKRLGEFFKKECAHL
jgi:aspartate/methionine/tyrosine aminotransferase